VSPGLMKRIPRVLVWSPAGVLDARVAVAGTRAGGLGVIDLGFRAADRTAAETIALAGGLLGRRPIGVRLRAESLSSIFLDGLPANLAFVIVSGRIESDWARARGQVRAAGRRPIAEVTSRAAAREAVAAGFGALIASGHEAGGSVSDDSSFILLQGVLADVPDGCRVWVRGGIGPSTAAGCVAAGAEGVVLDGALLLAKESPLAEPIRTRIAHWDGVETSVFGSIRGYAPPASPLLTLVRELEAGGAEETIEALVGWSEGSLWPAGQDSAFAAELARKEVTVGGIVRAVERAIDEGVALAKRVRPLSAAAGLSAALGTTYPIVQGPMTRVSDTPAFARAVADGGGFPFLAMAMMRGREVRDLLREATETLAQRSWGVGLLGFVPPELRREQTEAILDARPRFALIAGGRPDQAKELEGAGIATFLHVPSPGLLTQFLRDGARRFVLEGRECGGHVGPRSSFVLWEQAGRVLLDAIEHGIEPAGVHLLYAGGIHDARSAAVVAGVAAPLAALGVKVGVLVGTAYLFTREAVESGAIVEGFQRQALECSSTVLLETGPGHQVRVSPTPFADWFEEERERLLREGRSAEEIRTTLEGLNVGRLRIAAKGVDRVNGTGSPLAEVGPEDQRSQGLYMLGQAATLRDHLTTIADLHREIADGSQTWLERASTPRPDVRRRRQRPSDVAIIGMASITPGAADVRRFWQNTLRGHDAITEVPSGRWDWRLYYDADPKVPDKITSRWGGFVPEVPFDPLQYGMPPTSVSSIEPLHLLTLEVVRAALDDAGYRDRAFPRERTAVVLGAGGGAAQLAMGYAFRSYLPLLDTVIPGAGTEALAKCGGLLPEWTEDSFPGILLNVAAGRVANRFDLGGANYTVDAACGSSLAAASLAVRELESGAADMVVLGGADTVQNPFTYLAFSKTHAFSPRGRCRPFDAGADGIVISEAVAVVVLKRLADAERDGDRIYSVIKGIGASSDGRAKGLTAPRFEGQVRALRRAYEKAGLSPATVGYVEAHGTGTAAGDLAEVHALNDVFREAGAAAGRCALGSVKSLVGHTKCAAGLAGLINASLALYHRVLPPTIGVETLNPKAGIADSPFHVNTRARPWLRTEPDRPRRAGVSAFGFGGTNFHGVLEAYEGDIAPTLSPVLDWPAELFVFRTSDRNQMLATLDRLDRAVNAGPAPKLRDLAHTLSLSALETGGGPALSVVATSAEDLVDKLRRARRTIADGLAEFTDPAGIAFDDRGRWKGAPIAFLFPGQGSQSLDMLGELAVFFPEILAGYESFDRALKERGLAAVGPRVFPPITFDAAETRRQEAALAAPDVAQPALGAACVGLLELLRRFGLEPDVLAGHSYGELVALHVADVYPLDALALLSESRGRFLLAAVGEEPGAMAAVQAGPMEVEPLLSGLEGVVVANWNSPSQSVVSGPRAQIDRLLATAQQRGIRARALPVACGFHSPLVAAARAPLIDLAKTVVERGPTRPVYSNVTATTYPADAAAIPQQLGDHLASPVRFAAMIEAMHDDDTRIFVEVGPGSVLTALVGSILGDRTHLAVACDPPANKGLAALLAALGRLFVSGVSLDLTSLWTTRSCRRITMTGDRFDPTEPKLSPTTWLVNGARARPAFGPEPPRFGVGPALPVPSIHSPGRNGHASRVSVPAIPLVVENQEATPDPVFAAFQQTMQTFLDVQRSTMLGYLGSSRVAAPSTRLPAPTRRPEPATDDAPRPLAAAVAPVSNGHVEPEPTSEGAPAIERRLLGIVRDRTGYPAEMLRLDLDLEADLGIDSIKRVEILGTLRDSLPALNGGSESEMMDQLSRARTLGAIVEHVTRRLASRAGNGVSIGSAVRRMTIEAVDAPIRSTKSAGGLVSGGMILITDDRRGIGTAAEARLLSLGYRAVRVVHNVSDTSSEGKAWCVDLTSEDSVARLVDRARSEGRLAAILHALPLRKCPDAGLDAAVWSERLSTEVRGLFLLARACARDLEEAARQGGASLVAATGMGGGFASLTDPPGEFFAGHGAISGLVKTLAREWPRVRARVVDLDPSEEPERLAERLASELLADDDRAEVGYRRDRRISLRAVTSERSGSDGRGVSLRPGEPILITGGARGITAAVAADLARRWRPTLLLVGSSPMPAAEDAPDVAGRTSPTELKACLFERLNRQGRTVAPPELERAYQSLRREREIRSNLRTLRDLGARVEYAQIDVRDAEALGSALGRWRVEFGPLVGLIHGAGVIQDKLIRDKTPESFDRVVGTKLVGALNLARLVDPEALRFAAFFSSVAGRFGNKGQSDYAAANEALNKLAVWLDRRWPARVVSLIWGPWSGVGMVSDLESHLGRRGLGMIAPEEGRSWLGDELGAGRKGDVEVIVSGDLGNLAGASEAEAEPEP
jgi:acyl transferase domain-containing protein/NAD(P)H-dependent flavin oxidoreductase YrpB (nitropropane dioxygenase family)/NAD(P)-dependent dehydrogenase (short-subunit alcohol dehydrogenase family)